MTIRFDIKMQDSPPTASIAALSLPAGTSYLRITRMWAGQAARVPGDSMMSISTDTALISDAGVPIGIPVRWRVAAYDAADALIAMADTPQVMAPLLASDDDVWITDPLAPAMSVLARMMRGTDSQRTYAKPGERQRVIGAAAPTAIGGPRSPASSWQFRIKTATASQADLLETLVSSGSVLLIRANPRAIRYPSGLIYLDAETVTENPQHDDWRRGRVVWEITGDVVLPPNFPPYSVGRTYDESDGDAASYNERDARFNAYWEMDRG